MTRLTVALANLIVALAVLPGCARSADQPLAAQIDAVFREAHADGEFNGSVLVTRGDAVVYQVYLRSLADGNGDGIGDLTGLRARLQYLADLGIDAIWVNPGYPSPMVDGG